MPLTKIIHDHTLTGNGVDVPLGVMQREKYNCVSTLDFSNRVIDEIVTIFCADIFPDPLAHGINIGDWIGDEYRTLLVVTTVILDVDEPFVTAKVFIPSPNLWNLVSGNIKNNAQMMLELGNTANLLNPNTTIIANINQMVARLVQFNTALVNIINNYPVTEDFKISPIQIEKKAGATAEPSSDAEKILAIPQIFHERIRLAINKKYNWDRVLDNYFIRSYATYIREIPESISIIDNEERDYVALFSCFLENGQRYIAKINIKNGDKVNIPSQFNSSTISANYNMNPSLSCFFTSGIITPFTPLNKSIIMQAEYCVLNDYNIYFLVDFPTYQPDPVCVSIRYEAPDSDLYPKLYDENDVEVNHGIVGENGYITYTINPAQLSSPFGRHLFRITPPFDTPATYNYGIGCVNPNLPATLSSFYRKADFTPTDTVGSNNIADYSSQLKAIYLPQGVKNIAPRAIANLNGLETLVISRVRINQEGPFIDGDNLYNLPSLSYISSLKETSQVATNTFHSAFKNCLKLRYIPVVEAQHFDNDSFSNSPNIEVVGEVKSLKTVGDNFFSGNDKLRTYAYSWESSPALSTAGNNFFADNVSLEKIPAFYDGLTHVGDNCFANCISLGGVLKLPGLVSTGRNFLANCRLLEEVWIQSLPASNFILEGNTDDSSAFAECLKLKKIYVKSNDILIYRLIFTDHMGRFPAETFIEV